jgi:hypothetical protein
LILELGVFAGLPLLILYLLLQGLALRSAIKIVTSNGDVQLKVIVLAWIGFNLQSAINPSSLALVTLGFVLTGVVYGAARNLEGDSIAKKLQRPPKNRATRKGLGVRVMVSTLAVSIAGGGIYIATVPIVKDARFRDAFEQGDGRRMIEVSRQWPFNYQLSRQTAITLKANSYDNLAIGIVRDLVRENPYNIQGWRMLFEYSTTASERSRALNKMREIDPLNPEFAKLAP